MMSSITLGLITKLACILLLLGALGFLNDMKSDFRRLQLISSQPCFL